jgi:hypothetical protein
MAIPARFRSAYFWGTIVRLCLAAVFAAGVTSLIFHERFWGVFWGGLATIAFVVVLLEVLKIPGVYKWLAKIRTGLGLKDTSSVNQSSPDFKE